jgi:hypothetical protein
LLLVLRRNTIRADFTSLSRVPLAVWTASVAKIKRDAQRDVEPGECGGVELAYLAADGLEP